MADLFVLIGAPASGKSTWAQEQVNENTVWISRDKIRNEIVDLDHSDASKYFSKETLVYDTYICRITKALMDGKDVIADATHIDHKSRAKLIRMVRAKGVQYDSLIGVVFDTPKDVVLERNSKRAGWRRVPDRAIHEMYEKFERDINQIPQEGFDMIIDGRRGEVVYVK